jgi:AcrR family transcriptional regulator
MTDAQPRAAAASRRRPATGTRSGNGMSRARAGILSGAAKSIAKYGTRKTTMGDIATAGGVARATLYNHFRTKRDVYAALLADELDDLLGHLGALTAPAGSAESVVDALAYAAEWLSDHPVLRALREREPELAAQLARPAENAAWAAVRQAALQRVSLAVAAGSLHQQTDPAVAVDTLLRWAVSHVTWPAAPGTAEAAARQVVHGLRAAPYGAAQAAPAAARAAAPTAAPAAATRPAPAPAAPFYVAARPAAAGRTAYSGRPA